MLPIYLPIIHYVFQQLGEYSTRAGLVENLFFIYHLVFDHFFVFPVVPKIYTLQYYGLL